MELTTKGVVLREVNYKEADKILTVLTAEQGKLTVSARGCRRRGGGISAAAQLFAWSELTLSERGGRWTLKEAETEREFRGVRERLETMALASYFCELTELLAQEELPAPDTLTLLLNTLYVLEQNLHPLALVKAAFELRLLCIHGYAPMLDACAVCGAQAEKPKFNLQEGVLHCAGCKVPMGGGRSVTLDSGSLAAMRHICTCPGKKLFSFRIGAPSMKKLSIVCEEFVQTQLERGFRTLDFYHQVLALVQPN